jgi:NNP family nitrate/nitrite transporter-like MFS transporter
VRCICLFAAAIASIFGWMNLFARGLGGYISDKLNARLGIRGRLLAQTICLVAEGALVLIFANTKSLGGAVVVMVFFSVFVQAAEGSTYGIVPYVDPPATGSISGIVGAGGNTGAVCFGLCFRQLDYKAAFMIMGIVILVSAFTTSFIFIKGASSLIRGGVDEGPDKQATLAVPEPDETVRKEIEEEEEYAGDHYDDGSSVESHPEQEA